MKTTAQLILGIILVTAMLIIPLNLRATERSYRPPFDINTPEMLMPANPSNDIAILTPPPGLDYSTMITDEAWSPQVSITEDGIYYAAVQYMQASRKAVHVYRNTGDPATDTWTYVFGIMNLWCDLTLGDIEAVAANDRVYLMYQHSDDYEIVALWFDMSDPTTYGTQIVTSAPYTQYMSLTSDKVSLYIDVYVYACWTSNDIPTLYFSRTADLGISWNVPAVVAESITSIYMGNAIAYCPGDHHIFISYMDVYDDIVVAESDSIFGSGDWTSTTVAYSNFFSTLGLGGITSMTGNWILGVGSFNFNTSTLRDVFCYWSDDHGYDWEHADPIELPGNQLYPSCSSNNDGCVSVLFYDESTSSMKTALTTTDNLLAGVEEWVVCDVDTSSCPAVMSSACIEDGADPRFGGAWSDGTDEDADCFFGWADYEFIPLDLALYPHDPPVTIPASGGSFTYNVGVDNNSTTVQYFDFWIWAEKPDGSMTGPLLGPFTANMVPGASFMSSDKTQTVPGWAPAGIYRYEACVGSYPDDIVDSDSFTIEKLAGNDGSVVGGWFCDDGDLLEDFGCGVVSPAEHLLSAAHPNPFNPVTSIGYQLPAPGNVRLAVYDASGRRVADLVDGWRDAGMHEVTFNASGLASGIYIYRLTAGDFIESGKLVLMK